MCPPTINPIPLTIIICTTINRPDVRYVIPYPPHKLNMIPSPIHGTTENKDTITEHLHKDICLIGITYLKKALLINAIITLIPVFLTLRFFSDPIHIARPTCIYITSARKKHLRAWYTRFSPNLSIVLAPTCIKPKKLCLFLPSLSSEFHLILILKHNLVNTIHLYSPPNNDPPFHI